MADGMELFERRPNGRAVRPEPPDPNRSYPERTAQTGQDDQIRAASQRQTGPDVPEEVPGSVQGHKGRVARGGQDDDGLTIQTESDDRVNAPLTSFDVFSLIVNKMIGTGVYSSPATVYLMTGNKTLALGLWGVGFLYSLVSMALYLDYAAAFPYTGGELVYLYELTAHSGSNSPPRLNIVRRFLGDGLFAYVMYSIVFVGLWNSCTNALQFGRMVLVAYGAKETWVKIANTTIIQNGTSTYHPIINTYIQVSDLDLPFVQTDVNAPLMRFIGVVALSILCLIQLASPRAGRRMNKLAAIIKIGSVLALIGVIARYAVNSPVITSWSVWSDTKGSSSWDWAKALMAVIFSFDGWENATFVAGEIRVRDQLVLRKGFICAVVVVGVLYLAVAAVFLQAVDWEQLKANPNILYPALFSNDKASATQAWACVAAFSALGSMNSIIYTLSRVKQAIGQANILPWSRTWKEDHVQIVTSERGARLGHRPTTFEDQSPKGGLTLHWIMNVVVIAAVSRIDNTLESISVPGYLQIYAHAVVLIVLGALFYRLRGRETAIGVELEPHVIRLSHQGGWVRGAVIVMFFAYSCLNLVILVCAVGATTGTDGTLSEDNSKPGFRGFGYPAVVFTLLVVASIYYVLVFGAAVRVYPPADDPSTDEVVEPGLFSRNTWWNLLRLGNMEVEIRADRYYNDHLARVSRFGRRWRARYTPRPTSAKYQDHGVGDTSRANSWYWVFGGQRWIDVNVSPWDRFQQFLVDIEDRRGEATDYVKTQLAGLFPRASRDRG